MTDLIRSFFSARFLAHGLRQRSIIWLQAFSDAAIALAYLCIVPMLFHFVRKRKDVPFHYLWMW